MTRAYLVAMFCLVFLDVIVGVAMAGPSPLK